jgi:hypothetical protein
MSSNWNKWFCLRFGDYSQARSSCRLTGSTEAQEKRMGWRVVERAGPEIFFFGMLPNNLDYRLRGFRKSRPDQPQKLSID